MAGHQPVGVVLHGGELLGGGVDAACRWAWAHATGPPGSDAAYRYRPVRSLDALGGHGVDVALAQDEVVLAPTSTS